MIEELRKNNLKLVKEVGNNIIIIPESIYINDNKSVVLDKIDKYIEIYNIGIDIKNTFKDYMSGNKIDEYKFIQNINIFNGYEFKDLVSEDLKFYPHKLRERMIVSQEWLGLDDNEINQLKERAQNLAIESDKNIKLTNENLDKIVEDLKNSQPINIEDNNQIESNWDSYIVMGFDSWDQAKKDLKIYKRNDLSSDYQNIGLIYANKESLSYIINNKCKKSDINYIKYVKLNNNLSREDYNLIEAHAYAKFKPNLDINGKIRKNKKWATIRQLRNRFNIEENISDAKLRKAFEKVNGLIKFDIGKTKCIYSYLYDIELFELACERYDETESEPLGYIFKDNN